MEVNGSMDKMKYVSLKLEEWGGGLTKELYGQIKKCRTDMQKFRSRRDEIGVQKYEEDRGKYLRLLQKKDVYWKQRSKQFWLQQGDQISKFFS